MEKGCLYWITGLSGAGKTTIGTALYYKIREKMDNTLLLDGDILKNVFESGEIQYTEEARRERAKKYARLCKALVDQGMIVICCTIAMYDEVREWNRKENSAYVEVFLDVSMNILKERDQKGLYSGYTSGNLAQVAGLDVNIEFPKNPDLIICNDGKETVAECVDKILKFKVKDKYEKVDNINYWNQYYNSGAAPLEASSFAKYVLENYLEPSCRLLELGCGNGRDSLYFGANGIQVIGIDSSKQVILQQQNNDPEGNVLFVCDDFTKTNVLYQQQFNYCYSRFTLHAISLQQEEYVLQNVYQALKRGGKSGFFFIEVRGVHDEIYGKGEMVARDSYIYEGHFRRFIRREELEERLRQNGFEIISSEENRGLAVYKNQDPMVIRIVAKKR